MKSIWLLIAPLLVVACTSKSTNLDPGSDPSVSRFEVAAPGAKYQGTDPSQLSVSPGAGVLSERFWFGVDVRNRIKGWSFYMEGLLPLDMSVGQSVTATLDSSGRTAVGLAQIYTTGIAGVPDGEPDFGGGNIQMTFSPGTVTGEVIPADGTPRWTFGGINFIRCVVPISALPTPPQGQSGGTANDDKLETPQCQPYRPFAGPYQPVSGS